jgi:hypothetical protein
MCDLGQSAAMERWPQYARVRFINDRFDSEGVAHWTVGYILEVYEDAYEVEVSDASGTTVFIGGVPDVDLELAEPTNT